MGVPLKTILESIAPPKVVFDARVMANAMWKHNGLKVNGVEELQLMEFMVRNSRPKVQEGSQIYLHRLLWVLQRISVPIPASSDANKVNNPCILYGLSSARIAGILE